MAPSPRAQRRTHNLLLIQRLLSLRDGASPFTLLLDSLEQRAMPVMREMLLRAKSKSGRCKVVFVSFETLRKPANVDVHIKARCADMPALLSKLKSHMAPQDESEATQGRTLLVFDTLNPLAATYPAQLPSFLSSFLGPQTSLVAIYHLDIPVPSPASALDYYPEALVMLQYLATALLTVSSLSQAVERKRARDRSWQEPEWGLREDREGVVKGLSIPEFRGATDEVVLEMEIRRKSGRGTKDVFVLSRGAAAESSAITGLAALRREGEGVVCLLDDHPLFAEPEVQEKEEEVQTTFNLGLTEKQRQDREGVVLPYFDAQKGGGEGGRILYDMGREDDFDEEEDEI